MMQRFIQYSNQKKLCKSTDKILVAVSGGLDSMVLLHLFQAIGIKPAVAHANFQLRSHESDGDENFVRSYCERHNLHFFSERFDTNNYATTKGISTQMAARELRYQWFQQLVTEHLFDCVATAHHLSDNAETVLLNLIKGAGIDGLMGIDAKNGAISRPLLFATRNEIEIYAATHQLKWREDASNSSDEYQRNFLRHRIIPQLKAINPWVENAIDRSVEKYKGTERLAQIGLESWEKLFVEKNGSTVKISKTGIEHLENNGLYVYLKKFGFNLAQCTNICETISGQPGKKFKSKNWELVVDRGVMILHQLTDITSILISELGEEYALGQQKMQTRVLNRVEISRAKKVATLDAEKITLPLVWRKWKAGDAFYPFGMKYRKKLSNFFVDEKFSLADKAVATVVESKGEIV
ncbi:MAG: tRNA lysidine(34) synthetase TilS, partial [Flammeovirgaceae bacterium]